MTHDNALPTLIPAGASGAARGTRANGRVPMLPGFASAVDYVKQHWGAGPMEPTSQLVTRRLEPRGSAVPNSPAAFHREVHPSGIPPTSLGTLAVGVVAVAALYFGRELFVPVALAILLGFALAPPVLLLRRWHFGRVPSVIVVVVLAFR
jgi:hypothetical protein